MNFGHGGSFLHIHEMLNNKLPYNSSNIFFQMIDFSKIYCKLHPYELVNNFCTERNCLVGLCPTCICEHTDMHIKTKTQPQFENIRNTFTRVHEEIQDQIDVISKDKDRLGSLLATIKDKKVNFKSVLQKAKNDCLQLVRNHFQELEKTWQNEISNEEKKNNLHSSYRLDTLSALISKEISELIDESRRMNSIAFVEQIPRIEKEALVQSRAFHSRISQEFDDNEKYTPIINYTADNLKEVTIALKKLLSLEFSIPIKKYLANSNSQMLGRVSTISFKQQLPKSESVTNFSMVIKRPSMQKPHGQVQTQSSIYSVPMVLTSSYLNSYPSAKPLTLANQSEMLQKSRMSKINFTPSYIDRVQMTKHTKMDNKSQLKHKKSGLTLLGKEADADSTISEKENSKL